MHLHKECTHAERKQRSYLGLSYTSHSSLVLCSCTMQYTTSIGFYSNDRPRSSGIFFIYLDCHCRVFVEFPFVGFPSVWVLVFLLLPEDHPSPALVHLPGVDALGPLVRLPPLPFPFQVLAAPLPLVNLLTGGRNLWNEQKKSLKKNSSYVYGGHKLILAW